MEIRKIYRCGNLSRDYSLWLSVLTSVLIMAWYGGLMYQGDDLGYQSTFASGEGLGHGIWPLWKLINFWGFHWVYVNGRLGDKLAALSLGVFPQWVNAVFAGIMAGVTVLMVFRLSGIYRRRGWQTLSTLILFVYVFVFPWWDTLLYICCSFNYVWAVALQLVFIWMFFSATAERNHSRWVEVLISCGAFLVGWMHEAATGPLLVGLLWWIWWNGRYRALCRLRRMMLWAYSAGVAVVTLAPSIIARAGNPGVPDDGLCLLVLKSVPLTIVLVSVILALFIKKKTRHSMYERFKSDWGIWVIASVCSVVFICLGGKVGRSGWFSQTYAMIALVQLVRSWEFRIDKRIGAVLCVVMGMLILAHGTGLAIRLHKGGESDRHLRQLIADSKNGIVYFDCPSSGDEPWWTLGRVRLFKPYDSYSRYYIGLWNADSTNPVILPTAARAVDLSSFRGEELGSRLGQKFKGIYGVVFQDGTFISDGCPGDAVNSGIEWFVDDEYHVEIDGKEYVGVQFEFGG